MVNLLEVTYKRPTRQGEPAMVTGQRIIGHEDRDGREIDEALVDLILMGMQEGGFLPHHEGDKLIGALNRG